ncbi:hypothetical protein H8S95_15870 [Pontibacter sp. KCTC 32443]|uniref:hypothetical protein n=1 Tax=Pontibacter TaxID=323449 RepID=UPI00164DFB0C|nr:MULTISPECIES: hypothetical protein [Pontibacter]MBC5775555.1 hypothetical protein [Pontibacter sp. KCTC 32443]
MQFKQVVWMMATIVLLASCSSSKKSTSSRSVKEVILDRKSVRVTTGASTTRKDNGLHKGWYKNPNNPHHPNTTNPGHTKGKGKGKSKGKKK